MLDGRPIHALPTGVAAFLLRSPRPWDFAVLLKPAGFGGGGPARMGTG